MISSATNPLIAVLSVACVTALVRSPSWAQTAEPIERVEKIAYDRARVIAIENVTVAAESAGVVRQLDCRPGERVMIDQPLATLNRETFAAEVDVAREELRIARARATNKISLKYADKAAEVNAARYERTLRARELYANSISPTEVDRIRLELEQAKLSGQQAESELDLAAMNVQLQTVRHRQAQAAFEQRTIKAPLDGQVAQTFVSVGEWVSAGDPIVRIVNPQRLRIQGYFEKKWVMRIRVGSAAEFQFRIGDETRSVPAKITFVGTELVDGIFQVWAEIEKPPRAVLPGLSGRLTVDAE